MLPQAKEQATSFYGSWHLVKTKSRVERILLNRHELGSLSHHERVKTHAAIGLRVVLPPAARPQGEALEAAVGTWTLI